MKELKQNRFGFLLLLLGVFLASCKNDNTIIEPTLSVSEIPVSEVVASLSGVVTDENGKGIEDATIEIGINRKITDENGVFIFNEIEMNGLGTLVKVTKPGYFLSAQMIDVKAEENTNISVLMVPKNIVGTVEASAGGTVTTNEGSKITLPANGIVTSSGSSYTGVVNVAAKWIDPSNRDLESILPGELRTLDKDQLLLLNTFGILVVELEGASGEALNIATGSTASLEFSVPEELQLEAPETIPLWSLDESTGYWIEEGTATFDGTKYIGIVEHFSFWSSAVVMSFVNVEATIVDVNGNPLSGMFVRINSLTTGFCQYCRFTNESGIFYGKIPADTEFSFSVDVSGVCNDPLYEDIIGPFTTDVVLNTIIIDPVAPISYTYLDVTGQLEKCGSTNPVTNGYLSVNHGKVSPTFLFVDNNGQFGKLLYYCETDSEMTVQAFDFDEDKTSSLLTYSVPSGPATLDLGTISTCEDLVERIDCTVDGNDFILLEPYASLDGGKLEIWAFSPQDSVTTEISVEQVTGPGVYNPDWVRFNATFNNGTMLNLGCLYDDCSDFEIEISGIGNAGELIEGTFNGTIDDAGVAKTASGSFKIIRD